MQTDTLELLGDALRRELPLEDTKQSKQLRRLIVQLERRERELDRQRKDPRKPQDW